EIHESAIQNLISANKNKDDEKSSIVSDENDGYIDTTQLTALVEKVVTNISDIKKANRSDQDYSEIIKNPLLKLDIDNGTLTTESAPFPVSYVKRVGSFHQEVIINITEDNY